MPKLEEKAWQRVLVRHTVAAKQGDFERLAPLLKSPRGSAGATSSKGIEMLARIKQGKRWIIAVQFEGIESFTWSSLFSNTCSEEELFEAHCVGRRIETIWLGVEKRVCFFRHFSARNVKVRFTALTIAGPDQWDELECAETKLCESLRQCDTGQQAFDLLCHQYALPLPLPAMEQRKGKLIHMGPGRVGDWQLFRVHNIEAGENEAAEQLAEAIEAGDPKRVQAALAAGAPLDSLPESNLSPFIKVLLSCGRTQKWRECAELLVEAGCSVKGVDSDDSPWFDACRNFVPEAVTVEVLDFLLEHGADIDQRDHRGSTALFISAVDRRAKVVKFLIDRGADPHQVIPTCGHSTLAEIRNRAEKAMKYSAPNEYAVILGLLE